MDDAIFKSHDMNPLALQIRGTLRITFNRQFLEMRRSIQFDRQLTFRGKEVDNVRTYAHLSSELLTSKLSILQALPEDSFNRRRGIA